MSLIPLGYNIFSWLLPTHDAGDAHSLVSSAQFMDDNPISKKGSLIP